MKFLKSFEAHNIKGDYIPKNYLETIIKPIGDVSKRVEIRVDVEAVGHALRRQFRHGVSGERLTPNISQDDILDTIEDSLEELTIAMMHDKFDINQKVDNYPTRGVRKGEPNRFVIKNTKNDLNIVCELRPGEFEFKLLVITVMREPDFKTYKGQFVLEI
jgi:hypothetical protein